MKLLLLSNQPCSAKTGRPRSGVPLPQAWAAKVMPSRKGREISKTRAMYRPAM